MFLPQNLSMAINRSLPRAGSLCLFPLSMLEFWSSSFLLVVLLLQHLIIVSFVLQNWPILFILIPSLPLFPYTMPRDSINYDITCNKSNVWALVSPCVPYWEIESIAQTRQGTSESPFKASGFLYMVRSWLMSSQHESSWFIPVYNPEAEIVLFTYYLHIMVCKT